MQLYQGFFAGQVEVLGGEFVCFDQLASSLEGNSVGGGERGIKLKYIFILTNFFLFF